jgi:hypothetical protein
MQIAFTGRDGKQITVSDPRGPVALNVSNLPEPRRPTSWIISSWIIASTKV